MNLIEIKNLFIIPKIINPFYKLKNIIIQLIK